MGLAVFLPEKELTLFGSAELKKPFKGGKTKQPRPLWNVIVFEWRKARRNGLLKQLYVILTLAVILGYFTIAEQTHQKEIVYMDTLHESKELYEKVWIPDLERMVASGDEFGKEYHEKLLRYERETLEKNKAAIIAFENQDWISFYDYQNHVILQKDSLIEIERSVGGWSEWKDPLSKFTYDVSVAEKNWLKDKNIQPVLSGEYLLTIHDNWQDFQDLQKIRVEENIRIDNSGLYSLYIYFDKYFYFIPLMLFLFLLGAGFANEKGKKKTLQLLKTQPVAEKKIFLGKGIYASTTALISSVGLFAFVILVATVFNRFGDWHYPILRYDSRNFVDAINFEYDGIRTIDGAGHFISLGNYLMESIGLFLCVSLFLISLSIFLSLFFKSQFGLFMTTILIGVIGYVGSRELLIDSAHLSPFTYFDISKITNGEVSALVNNPSITAQSGYLVLLGSRR